MQQNVQIFAQNSFHKDSKDIYFVIFKDNKKNMTRIYCNKKKRMKMEKNTMWRHQFYNIYFKLFYFFLNIETKYRFNKKQLMRTHNEPFSKLTKPEVDPVLLIQKLQEQFLPRFLHRVPSKNRNLSIRRIKNLIRIYYLENCNIYFYPIFILNYFPYTLFEREISINIFQFVLVSFSFSS